MRTPTIAACLEISFLVDENILWLQIAIDDVECMQVLESQDDLSSVERRVRLATSQATSAYTLQHCL